MPADIQNPVRKQEGGNVLPDPDMAVPVDEQTRGGQAFPVKVSIQNLWRIGIGLLCSLLALFLVVRLNGEAVDWSRISEISPLLTIGLFGMIGLAWICNGLRTWIMARTLGHHMSLMRAIGITLSSEFAIAATPGGIGGVGVRVLLQKRQGIPAMKSMAMFGTDVAADSLFFALLAPFGLAALLHLEPFAGWIRGTWSHLGELLEPMKGHPFGMGLIAVAGAVLTGIAIWRMGRRQKGKAERHSHRSIDSIRVWYRKWTDSMGDLWIRNKKTCALVVAIAAVQWTCRYGVLVFLVHAMGFSINPLALFLLQGSLFALSLVVVVPGGGGSVELLSSLVLNPLMGGGIALMVVVLWRLFTYYLYLVGGGIAFALQAMIPGRRMLENVVDPVSESVS